MISAVLRVFGLLALSIFMVLMLEIGCYLRPYLI
jgi:hypothetical protein